MHPTAKKFDWVPFHFTQFYCKIMNNNVRADSKFRAKFTNLFTKNNQVIIPHVNFWQNADPSQGWVIDHISIPLRTFTSVTMPCSYDTLSQFRHKTELSNEICNHWTAVGNVKIHLIFSITSLYLLEIVNGTNTLIRFI